MQDHEIGSRRRRAVFVAGVSVLAVAGAALPALAQDANNNNSAKSASEAQAQPSSEIVVTGIRGSLQRSMLIKKESLSVVDAISAEDIGKFPDANLAAALQRVPGVTVTRGAAALGGVPTSTGDATQVTVRGFGPTFNETLFDGRPVATALFNRGFDFSAVGSDFVGQLEVLKTPDATLSSGALGATINVRFPKPFDHPGLQLAGTASGSVSNTGGGVTPNFGVLFSDTSANERMGVLVDFHYSDLKNVANHVNIQGWEGTTFDPSQFANPPSGPQNGWFIQDYGIYQEHNDEKRYDGRAVLQFRPTDDIEITLNDDYSKDRLLQHQYGYSVWFNGGSLTDITLAPNGTVTNFIQPNTPTDFQGQINASLIVLNEFGADMKWRVNDSFTAFLDFDQSVAQLNPNGEITSIDADVGYGPSGPGGTNGVNVGIAGIGAGQLPYPTAFGPGGDTSQFINNGLIGSHVLPIGSNRDRDRVNQFKVGGDWKGDHMDAKFGFQWIDEDRTLSTYDDFANNDWQAYSGYGPASNNAGGVALPQSFFTNSFSTSNFIGGLSNNGRLPPDILVFNPYTVLNYLQGLGNPQTTNIPGAGKTCCTPPFNGVYQIELNPGGIPGYQQIDETIYAVYFNLSGDGEIGRVPVRYNLGVRAEDTEITTTGIGQLPTSLTQQTSDLTAFLVGYAPAAPQTAKNSYRDILPNLDVVFSLTDALKLRFNASRTLTRPPLNYLNPVITIPGTQRVGALVATAGNGFLKPYTSDNVDLGLEWYYGPNSYAAINGFAKEVDNFIVGNTAQGTINGVIDPTTGQPASFSITSQVNGPSATVYGVEMTIQHTFGDTGFGVLGNGTIVATNKPYNPNDITTSGFAVTGLADSANAVLFWEKYGFSLRAAVNWRGAYIDHFGQQQNNSHFGTEPTFVNSNFQVDLSGNYTFKDHYTVFVEAINVNGANYSTHGRFSNQLLDVVDYGSRYTVGMRFKF